MRSFGHLRTILALILREMSGRYGRNPGGYIWAILEPLGMITLLSLGFALMLRSPPLGNSFLLFYATGYLPFSVFQSTSRQVMGALNFSRSLLRYPAVTWIDAVIARAVLNLLTSLLVACLLYAGILTLLDTATSVDFIPILVGFGVMGVFGFGLGLVNCAIQGLFPVWTTIWGIITRPIFLASGLLWLYRDLPTVAQDILWWNPLVHGIVLVRTGFYASYEAHFVSALYMLGCGLVITTLGLILMRRYHLEILSRR